MGGCPKAWLSPPRHRVSSAAMSMEKPASAGRGKIQRCPGETWCRWRLFTLAESKGRGGDTDAVTECSVFW